MTLFDIARRRGVLALGAVALSVAVAACGSSTSNSTSGSSGSDSPTTSTTASHSGFNRTAFRQCLEKHGVTLPNRPAGSGPPPGAGGGFFGGGGGSGGGAFSNPNFRAAIQACGGGNFRFRGTGGRFPLSHTAIDQFVTCIRQHGYRQMPNPNFSGKRPIFPASVRTNSKFESAARSCESLLRPSTSGSGTGTSTTSSS